jgi:hypothetical protein
MYCQSLVVCIKVDGKIIREDGDKVYLPFGSDYSIYLKNLNTVKCKIPSISIDGENVLDNNALLLPPDSSIELEGFMENNMVHNKFRFIEKTEQISQYRGNKPEDGLVCVDYQFQNIMPFTYTLYNSYDVYNNGTCDTEKYKVVYTDRTTSNNITCNCNTVPQEGITVKGQETNQVFNQVSDNDIYGSKFRIILKLLGNKGNKIITTHDKIKCPTCGRNNKSKFKYCTNCGTYLR